MKTDRARIAPGVLADHQLNELVSNNSISNASKTPDESAIDLTLGDRAWKLKAGLRPTTRELNAIRRSVDPHPVHRDDKGEYFHFSADEIYLVELQEWLDLPPNISGRATGKSTIGRLDVITRLLTADAREYDTVPENYEGNLYLLLSPQTFDVMVKPGDSLNQLRLFCGPQHAAVIDRQMIEHYGRPFWHILKHDGSGEYEPWDTIVNPPPKRAGSAGNLTLDPHLFDLTVDLGDPASPFIYKAKSNVDGNRLPPLDVWFKDYDPTQYFEVVHVQEEAGDRFVILDRGSFYIMKSRERLSIPTDVAVEVIAISERTGDIRIHYAGFAHPGFGTQRADDSKGTPLIFEVRATDMKTKLFNRSVLAKIQLFRMSEPYKGDVKSTIYGSQELQLSKVFAEWPNA